MHFGLTIFPTEYSISMVDLGRAAEERGFESLWVSEHTHIPVSRKSPWPGGPELPKMYYDTLDPFVALAAAASATSRIKLATGICLIVERDPIHTAKLVTSVDQVSGGRFMLGIGGGWNLEEMENHGTRPESRFKLMRERIEAMKAIWTQDEAEYHGDLVDFDPIFMRPKPIQKPHPPIHVGGGFPGGARRAIATDGCPSAGATATSRSGSRTFARWQKKRGGIRRRSRSRSLPRNRSRMHSRVIAMRASRASC